MRVFGTRRSLLLYKKNTFFGVIQHIHRLSNVYTGCRLYKGDIMVGYSVSTTPIQEYGLAKGLNDGNFLASKVSNSRITLAIHEDIGFYEPNYLEAVRPPPRRWFYSSKLNELFCRYCDPMIFAFINPYFDLKNTNFRDDLSEISVKTATLVVCQQLSLQAL